MQAGFLNEVIEVWKPQLLKDDYGQEFEEYAFAFSTRAKVDYNSGTRAIENSEIFNGVNRQFTVRSYADIDYKSIIHFKDEKYRVIAIDKQRTWNQQVITTELVNE